MKRRRPAPDGTVFLVPLRDGGHAIGVLARATGEGHAFGYFFGPRILKVSDVNMTKLSPKNAILAGKFGDLEILRKNWPVVGVLKDWAPEGWPMLPMARIDEATGRAWLATYDDSFECTEEKEIDTQTASQYPHDRMMGAGAVEIRLTSLIRATEKP
ncbi:immunity 26/phosphotriesterase HocA family protein [Sorangium sp. So ce1335]|uniref:immunity 26/phosphotriesterase HocA family protein n=1 Tax=Sorangium sp. So ce1335 TaxID=3133335 RepID=UPI003F5F5780